MFTVQYYISMYWNILFQLPHKRHAPSWETPTTRRYPFRYEMSRIVMNKQTTSRANVRDNVWSSWLCNLDLGMHKQARLASSCSVWKRSGRDDLAVFFINATNAHWSNWQCITNALLWHLIHTTSAGYTLGCGPCRQHICRTHTTVEKIDKHDLHRFEWMFETPIAKQNETDGPSMGNC